MNVRIFGRMAGAAAGMALAAGAAFSQCPGGETPANFCTMPRVLGGGQGVQVAIVNTSIATSGGEQLCDTGVTLGHTVWFSMVPSVSGLLTFNTCHPSTTYDTVAQVYSGGDSGCEFMTRVQCNDDTASTECNNGCSAWGSSLAFHANAGTMYRFVVGSYNNNSAGCNLCLGVVVTLCGEGGDSSPPEATISAPASLACVCPGGVGISGSVGDSESGVAWYVLDYASDASPSWTQISRGLGHVFGMLGTWNTGGLAEGDYYLRLSARNGCGTLTSTVRTVHVDAGLDSLVLRKPSNGNVLGGWVVADGTAWDHCAPGQFMVYWLPLGGSATPFDVVNPPWVVNDPLGSWYSRNVVDGQYTVRAYGANQCGVTLSSEQNVTIDNTPPIAVIGSPLNCQMLSRGLLQIRGTALDAHLASWVLQYAGGDAHGWVTIASGTNGVNNNVLGTWDTRGLRTCQYALRLIATDSAVIDDNGAIHNQTEHLVTVAVGCAADFNNSGAVSVQDMFDFLAAYFTGCP